MKKNLKIIIPAVVLVIVAIISIVLILENKNQEEIKNPVTTTAKEKTTLAVSTEGESSTELTDSTTTITTEKVSTTTLVTNIPVTKAQTVVQIPATQAPVTQAPATQPPVTQAPPPPPTTQPPVNYKMAILELVNKERANAGVAPLSYYYEGQTVGDIRASEICTSFSHTRPNGTECFTAAEEAGVSYMTAGENLAYGYSTPEEVMNGWMNSPGHRSNILDPEFTHIVVGRNGSYWVQFFFGFQGINKWM
jgi:uncharacterized protein YkwD